MGTASDDRGDLSVRLEWLVDPLISPAPATDHEATDHEEPSAQSADRVEALEAAVAEIAANNADPAVFEAMAARLEYVGAEMVEALRGMNDTVRRLIDESVATIDDRITGLRTAMTAMLASRQAEEQRTQRREREAIIGRVEQDMTSLAQSVSEATDTASRALSEAVAGTSRTLTEALAASRTQSDVFADRVAAELQALRRRIPVKANTDGHAMDDSTMEELVSRVADEVEIRIAAALKPKSTRHKA